MDARDSGYAFAEHADGVTISAPDRGDVRVTAYPCFFCAEETAAGRRAFFGFYEMRRFARWVARVMMPEGESRTGALERTRRTLGRPLAASAARLREGADPLVLAVQRALYSADPRGVVWRQDTRRPEFYRDFYRRAYLVSDLLRYPACARAVLCLPEILFPPRFKIDADPIEDEYIDLDLMQLSEDDEEDDERQGCDGGLFPGYPAYDFRPDHGDYRAMMERLGDWKGVFSPDDRPYRSLNRTLMNLPPYVPAAALKNLRHFRLARPLTSRSELLLTCCAIKRGAREEGDGEKMGVLLAARRPDILRAMKMVRRETGVPLDGRRTESFDYLAGYLLDFPGEHSGSITGLAARSIRWHREHDEEARRNSIEGLDPAAPLARPPAPLPEGEGITFLDTVGALLHEGGLMRHCVATYAASALKGDCYLFHVERDGETATVEVDRQGAVVQARGPGNTINAACRWSRRVLARWGRGLSDPPTVD